jgi:hypothetical protein
MPEAWGLGTLIQSGTLVARPVAGVADRYYWATDIYTMFRDTGVAWEVVAERPFIREICSEGLVKGSGATTFIGANIIHYSPVQIRHTVTIDTIDLRIAGTAIGNVYVGIYDENPANPQPLNLLAQSALTALAGINQRQRIPLTAQIRLTPNVYYAAIVDDQNDQFTAVSYWGNENIPLNLLNGLQWFREVGAVLPPIATPAIENGGILVPFVLHVVSVP